MAAIKTWNDERVTDYDLNNNFNLCRKITTYNSYIIVGSTASWTVAGSIHISGALTYESLQLLLSINTGSNAWWGIGSGSGTLSGSIAVPEYISGVSLTANSLLNLTFFSAANAGSNLIFNGVANHIGAGGNAGFITSVDNNITNGAYNTFIIKARGNNAVTSYKWSAVLNELSGNTFHL